MAADALGSVARHSWPHLPSGCPLHQTLQIPAESKSASRTLAACKRGKVPDKLQCKLCPGRSALPWESSGPPRIQ